MYVYIYIYILYVFLSFLVDGAPSNEQVAPGQDEIAKESRGQAGARRRRRFLERWWRLIRRFRRCGQTRECQ